jgi:hypothetical protein
MCQNCCCGCNSVNKQFPAAGDLFTVRVSGGHDRSYNDSVFKCTVSDSGTVVAEQVVGYSYRKTPFVFGRNAFVFTKSYQCIVNAASRA